MSQSPRRLFISVAEDSADRYGAEWARAAQRRWPGVELVGFAGPRMQAAGVRPLADLTQHAAMLTGVFKLIGRGWSALSTAAKEWQANRPDAVIVMDSTALHLPMAARARQRGLPVVYYIAPQTWASRPGRNRKLAKYCDRVACILPFEEAWLRGAGVNATFVGHPLAYAVAHEPPPTPLAPAASGAHRVALLPGSRSGVIARMLPLLFRVARQMVSQSARPIDFRVSCSSPRREAAIRDIVAKLAPAPDVRWELVTENLSGLLEWCDLALVTSGTATLEVALHRKPMVVLYDVGSPLRELYPLGGRFVVRTAHLSLVNILADRRIVPEYMPIVRDITGPARDALDILRDDARRASMLADIESVCAQLRCEVNPAERVCDLIADTLRASHR